MNIKKTLAIIGSGHLGLHIAHYAIYDKHYNNVVFIDDFSKESEINGIKIIGKTSDIEELFEENIFNELIIGIGYSHLEKRKELFNKYKNRIPFGKIIHSSCRIDSTAIVKDGCVLYPNSSIELECVVHENTIIANNTMVAHIVIIDRHCFVSACVAIAGFAHIHELCYLGINSTIIDSVTIDKGTQIGAGTVVIKSIDKSGLYVGNPHRLVK